MASTGQKRKRATQWTFILPGVLPCAPNCTRDISPVLPCVGLTRLPCRVVCRLGSCDVVMPRPATSVARHTSTMTHTTALPRNLLRHC